MALATHLMNREQYEDRCRERLEISFPDDPDRVTRALLHRYPATRSPVMTVATKDLVLAAHDVALEAGAAKRPTIPIVAYGGGLMGR